MTDLHPKGQKEIGQASIALAPHNMAASISRAMSLIVACEERGRHFILATQNAFEGIRVPCNFMTIHYFVATQSCCRLLLCHDDSALKSLFDLK